MKYNLLSYVSIILFAVLQTAVYAKEGNKTLYDETITKDAVSSNGIINIHLVKGTLYLEIPKKIMGKPLLFASKVSGTSNNKDVIAGQMPVDPLLIEWSYDSERVYMHENVSNNICDSSESIVQGYRKNNINPVFRAFPIKCFNNDSSAIVIDVTKYFLSDQKPFSPFIPASPVDAMLGNKKMSGSFKQELSSILSFKAFPQNINITTRLVFTVGAEPFTAEVTSSMLLLPDKPMKPRYADKRVGYFTCNKKFYTSKQDYIKDLKYINRWRLEPKKEDIKKHKSGGLVEPEKQIVFYIDSAFPKEWRPFIKQGVEAWNVAFEKAGFKNAIVAKDYPDSPDFDPSDIRYSCIIYSPSEFANAMGPSWVDPRSGEIVQGSVYVYHNVLSLLHGWRFIQTAAIDPKARAKVYDMELMGPLLRYLITHEVGHTLGLMHNMRGSYAFPTDSLRSPYFTSKYGTTASIMDYARCNYVAQPGDGVRDLLPKLGEYDIFAIKYGYAPVYNTKTPEDEFLILKKWVTSVAKDPVFKYGEQQLLGKDPASQSESLGDDAVKAGYYGIENLKILTNNLISWTSEDGESYDYTELMFKEIHKQFVKYINHCITYIGGQFINNAVAGDGQKEVEPVSVNKQKEALNFVLKQIYEYPDWILNKDIIFQMPLNIETISSYPSTVIKGLLGKAKIAGIGTLEKITDNPYTVKEYLDDIYLFIWNKTIENRQLDEKDKALQYVWIHTIMDELSMLSPEAGNKSAFRSNDMILAKEVMNSNSKESYVKIVSRPILFSELQKAYNLLNDSLTNSCLADREYYKYLLYEIGQAIKY